MSRNAPAPGREREPGGRRDLSRGRLLLLSALTTVLALSIVEGGSRWLEARGGARPREAVSPCEFQQVDPTPSTPFVPGAPPGTRLINWADVRPQTFVAPRPPGVLRVVFVGGSALGGWGVPRHRQLAGVAGRLLDEAIPDRTVEVVNLGTTGWGSAQFAWTLEALGPQLEPDLVVLLMGNNERMDVANGLALARGGPSLYFASRWLHRTSAFARLLRPVPDPPGFDDPAGPGPLSDADRSLPMPRLEQLEAPERVDRFIRRRLRRTVRRIAESTGAPTLVSSVPVNHRYWRSRHEWHFVGEDVATSPQWREAYWAWYHDAPERGAAALERRLAAGDRDPGAHVVLGSFLARSGEIEAARRHWQTALDQSDIEVGGLPARLVRAWAIRELRGSGAARELVAPWIGPAPPEDDPAGHGCHAAELLWVAGAREEAARRYQECLLNGFLYRADPVINGALRQAAGDVGAEFLDLDAAVREASRDRIPGFEYFVDYCHYTPRGHLLVGHLLASAAAEMLELPGQVPAAAAALAEDRAARAGRPFDRPELEHWAGASFDVGRLQSPSPRDSAPDDAPVEDTPMAWTFFGNEHAASASFAWAAPGEAALDAWLHALELDPSYAPARHNLELVLSTELGGWTLRNARRGEALRRRLLAAEVDFP